MAGPLAVCFVGMENFIDTAGLAIIEGARAEVAGTITMTKAVALVYLMLNLYMPPCSAAIGAMNAEMKSTKWLWGGIALQLGIGYTVGYLVYQVGTVITTGSVGAGFLPGLAAILIMTLIVGYLSVKGQRDLSWQYNSKGVKQ